MGLTAFAVLMPACILLILDHVAGTSFFIPSGLVINDQLIPHSGGSTLLWQHLFWFFGHPEVYIAIVPGMGIVTHVLMTNMRRPMLSMKAILYSFWALAFLSYMVYGHHMFVSGMNPFSSLLFSFPTLTITIPATILTLIWLGSLYGANIRITAASLFALGFVSMFVSGGVSGFFLAQPSIDIYLHATYFVVGHFHMVMGVAAIFGILSGTYFWFPKMTGYMYSETIGKLHFWITFIGVNIVFFPQHFLGLAGMPRRIVDYPDAFAGWNLVSSLGSYLSGFGALVFFFGVAHAFARKQRAGDNPWGAGATTLEWTLPSPPPFHQYSELPVIR